MGIGDGRYEELEYIVNKPFRVIRVDDFNHLNRNELVETIHFWMQSPSESKYEFVVFMQGCSTLVPQAYADRTRLTRE